MVDSRDKEPKKSREFAELTEASSPGIIRESLDWLSSNRKWWLAPIVIALLLAVLFVVYDGSAIAPFVSALF